MVLPASAAVAPAGSSAQILFGQIRVDCERSLGPFGGGYDDPLHGAGGITGHEQAVKVGGLIRAGPDGTLVVELAPEANRDFGLLRLPGPPPTITTS